VCELPGKLGFSDVVIVAPAEVTDRYLQGRRDALPAPRRATIVRRL
jgi:hypothetical protein